MALNWFEAHLLLFLLLLTENLYSGWNITLSIVILVALILLFISMAPKKENIVEYQGSDEGEKVYGYIDKSKKEMTFSERLEHSYWVNLLLAAMPVIYIVSHFKDLGFNLNLNMIILIFLALALLLHRNSLMTLLIFLTLSKSRCLFRCD